MPKQFRSEYYEAIIQVRPRNEDVLQFIMNQIRKRNDVFVSKSLVHKTGVDVYVSSQKFARALGNKLKRQFKGKVLLSYQLYTRNRQTSRDVHRLTVLFRVQE